MVGSQLGEFPEAQALLRRRRSTNYPLIRRQRNFRTGRGRCMTIFKVVVILTVLVTPLEAQWLDRRTPHIPRTADGKPNLTAPAPPRTADGKPDLSGLWEVFSPDTAIGNVLLRKPGDLQPADIQPWVQALLQQRAENFGIDNPRYQCLPDGPNY